MAPYCAARAGDREPLAGQVALEDRGAHVADRLLAARAVAAVAAVGDERADDVVAGLDPGDARADLLDDARALVAEHHRQPGLEVAVGDVHVGVAQARVGVADQDLALLGPVEVELLDLDAACPASYTTAAVVFMRLLLGPRRGSVACESVAARTPGAHLPVRSGGGPPAGRYGGGQPAYGGGHGSRRHAGSLPRLLPASATRV